MRRKHPEWVRHLSRLCRQPYGHILCAHSNGRSNVRHEWICKPEHSSRPRRERSASGREYTPCDICVAESTPSLQRHNVRTAKSRQTRRPNANLIFDRIATEEQVKSSRIRAIGINGRVKSGTNSGEKLQHGGLLQATSVESASAVSNRAVFYRL